MYLNYWIIQLTLIKFHTQSLIFTDLCPRFMSHNFSIFYMKLNHLSSQCSHTYHPYNQQAWYVKRKWYGYITYCGGSYDKLGWDQLATAHPSIGHCVQDTCFLFAYAPLWNDPVSPRHCYKTPVHRTRRGDMGFLCAFKSSNMTSVTPLQLLLCALSCYRWDRVEQSFIRSGMIEILQVLYQFIRD